MKWLFGFAFLFSFNSLFSQCLDGKCWDGKGTYLYPSGAKYVGHFKDGKIHGKGTLYFSNGDKYQGDWIDHYRTGKGTLVKAKGGEYTGDFKKNKFHGIGKYIYPTGDIYVGEWINNIAEGEGEYSFVNGNYYVGKFKEGKFHGKGTMYYTDDSYFVGNWAKNKKEGAGKMVGANGKSIEGNWQNGVFQKDGASPKKQTKTKIEKVDKKKIVSEVKTKSSVRNCNDGSCMSGQGEFVYRDGSKYLGEFYKGLPLGQGTVFYANGDKYVGGWSNHAPNGEGLMHYKYGRTLGAFWQDGKVIKVLNSVQNIPDEIVEIKRSLEVKIWSVLVGVGRYNHMPALKYTDDDAYRLFAFLKSPQGGAVPDEQIRVLIDEEAQRENILRQMKRIFLQADENDVVIFYFSGHGYDGSFIPFDYDGYNNLLKHEEVIKVLSMSKAKHKIVFADACHSGSLLQEEALAAKTPNFKPISEFYDSFDRTKGGLALLLSSKKDEYSLEDQGLRQGVFSHYLMRGLKGEANTNRDKIIDITELYNYVQGKVKKYTNGLQSPNISGNYDPKMPVSFER